MDITVLGTACAAGAIRSIAGWIENAMEDGEISKYEIGELGATIFRTTVLTVSVHYGLGLGPVAAAGGAILGDFILKTLKARPVVLSE